MFPFKKKRIYLDHASTTPLHPAAFSAMKDAYENGYYNPGSLYKEGVEASRLVASARATVAKLLGTTSRSVVFTRGGTESINLALTGAVLKWRKENPGKIPHVIMSDIEHAAAIETLRAMARRIEIHLSDAPVNADGIVDVDALKKMLRPETILVSVMYANNEIGTVQPIREIAKLLRWFKKHNELKTYPLLHTDAVQAANYLDLDVARLGVDLMSLSGSKIYGPKSSGVLYARDRDLIAPVLHGGDQEFGLRPGTEDVAAIAGFAKAFEIARADTDAEAKRLAELQNYFFAELKKAVPDIIVNGSETERLPNNINVTVPGISGERLVIELDAKGICASSKSACKEDSGEESHVIAAIREAAGLDTLSTDGSVRFTTGRGTEKADIARACREFGEIVSKIREFSIY